MTIIKIIFHFEGIIKQRRKGMHCQEEFGFALFFILNLEIVVYYFSCQNIHKTSRNLKNIIIKHSVWHNYL